MVVSSKEKNLSSKTFANEASESAQTKRSRGRNKIANKRDKTYTFYCTQDKLNELENLADARHLTMAEYFRIKLFS